MNCPSATAPLLLPLCYCPSATPPSATAPSATAPSATAPSATVSSRESQVPAGGVAFGGTLAEPDESSEPWGESPYALSLDHLNPLQYTSFV